MSIGVRRVLAGFLAGVCSLAGIIAIPLCLLLAAGLTGFIRDRAFGTYGDAPFWGTLGRSLVQSLAAVPGYFWSARWGMLALGLVGIPLALIDGQRGRLHRPWQDRAGFVATMGLSGVAVVGLQYGTQQGVSAWAASQPGLPGRDQILSAPHSARLTTAVLVALGTGFVVWIAWSYWYDKWARRLKVERPRPAVIHAAALAAAPEDDWREQQRRVARLKGGQLEHEPPESAVVASGARSASWTPRLLAGLLAATVLAFLALQAYIAVGPAVASAGFWVRPDAPRAAVELSVPRAPRQLVVSNVAGAGVVDLAITPEAGAAPVRSIGGMRLSESPARHSTAELSLAGLRGGEYRLEAALTQGSGGFLEYVALYGGGLAGGLAALALGLAVGLWLAVGAVLLLELLSGVGVLDGAVR